MMFINFLYLRSKKAPYLTWNTLLNRLIMINASWKFQGEYPCLWSEFV